MRRRGGAAVESVAEAVGFQRGLYPDRLTVWSSNPVSSEEHWQSYEGPLDAALDILCEANGLFDAKTWLHVLVPFVAS